MFLFTLQFLFFFVFGSFLDPVQRADPVSHLNLLVAASLLAFWLLGLFRLKNQIQNQKGKITKNDFHLSILLF
jgi:hypothetical protein